CMQCGPGGLGQCVGPSVCCSPHFGCYMNTEESEVCHQENKNTAPCSISGQACGVHNTGHCVAVGVCCDYESCSVNERCILNKKKEPDVTIRSEVVQLIEKLLGSVDSD
ncbi:unnamed protein product, partial [Candidula unifasciata]